MKIKFKIFILLFIGFCTSWSTDEYESGTNLDIIKNLYNKGFTNAFQTITALDSVFLYFDNKSQNKTIDWLIDEQFVKSAREAGFTTLIQGNGSSLPNKEKKYRIQ